MKAHVQHCAHCAGPARPVDPAGVYLPLIANGRLLCDGCGRFQTGCECRSVAEQRERWRRNQRARRSRLVASGLTQAGTTPIPERRVVSWSRGPYHLPRRGPDGRCTAGCGRRVYRNADGGWRHR